MLSRTCLKDEGLGFLMMYNMLQSYPSISSYDLWKFKIFVFSKPDVSLSASKLKLYVNFRCETFRVAGDMFREGGTASFIKKE